VPHLGEGYCVSTVGRNDEIIREYIEKQQEKEDQRILARIIIVLIQSIEIAIFCPDTFSNFVKYSCASFCRGISQVLPATILTDTLSLSGAQTLKEAPC